MSRQRFLIVVSLATASDIAWHLKLRAYVRRYLGIGPEMLPCQLEREVHTIQQARIALWRSGTLKVR